MLRQSKLLKSRFGYVRLDVLRDAPTGALDRLERRLRVQQHQRPGRGHGATLVGPVWV